MSGNKLFPNSLFKNRKQDSNDDEREQRKRAALDLVKQNCNAMNKSSTEPKAKKSAREKAHDDIFDVPATQVSPAKSSRRSFDFPTPLVDKSLKRLQKPDRHSMSMVSSPSMMKPKPAEQERKQPKTADAIFEELKKSEEASQAVAKVAAETKSDQRSTVCTSDDDKMQVDQPAPVVTTVQESRDWTKINPESLDALKESTQSLRSILEELKKANDKISEFRQAIVKEV